MRKNLRVIALTLAIAVCVLMLSSCNMLDELKAKRVTVLADGSDILEYNGKTYVRINTDSLADDRKVGILYDYRYYAVKNSFPLLLMEKFGQHCYYEEDFDIMWINDAVDTYYYAPEDKAVEYSSIINSNGKLENYKVYYSSQFGGYPRSVYMLSTELTEAINTANRLSAPTEVWLDSEKGSEWSVIYIDRCDEYGLVQSVFQQNLYMDAEGNYGVLLGAGNDGDRMCLSIVPLGEEFDEEMKHLFNFVHSDRLFSSKYVEKDTQNTPIYPVT